MTELIPARSTRSWPNGTRSQLCRDLAGVAGCSLALLAGIVVAALLAAPNPALHAAPLPAVKPWTQYWTHNATIACVWALGMLSFGTVTVLFALIFVATTGTTIEEFGLASAWPILTHAPFELVALGVALWIALAPARWVYIHAKYRPMIRTILKLELPRLISWMIFAILLLVPASLLEAIQA